MGITNDGIDKFYHFANVRILSLNEEQIDLLLNIEVANNVLSNVTQESNEWNSNNIAECNNNIIKRVDYDKKLKDKNYTKEEKAHYKLKIGNYSFILINR